MKFLYILSALMLMAIQGNSQKVSDPCQKLDTNSIKRLIIGTWVEAADTSHYLIFTEDSLTERIMIKEGAVQKVNLSYWSYKFTDNIFSSETVTCYSLYEYKEGYSHHTDFPINGLDEKFLMLGANGKFLYKRKN